MTIRTGRYGFRVPEASDPPRGWEQLLALAEDIEAAVGAIDDRLTSGEGTLAALDRQVERLDQATQVGVVPISFNNRAMYVHDLTFPRPFGGVPVPGAGIVSGAGETARWGARAINPSATGMQLFVFSDGGSSDTADWDDINVIWWATYRP